MTDNQPISLGQSDTSSAGATPAQDLTPRLLADQRISTWFSRHGQPYVSTNGGFAASVRPTDNDGAEPVQLRVMATDTRPPGILFAAAGSTRYARDKWPEALTACNVWNGREPAARARLAVNDWEQDQEAAIVLEAWIPLLPTTSQDVVTAVGDGLVASAARFWFIPNVAGTSG
jgi:hypothetical protein